MITNTTQLNLSQEQLHKLRDMLEAVRVQTAKRNPSLFVTVSKSYLEKIKQLEDEIISYLRENPASSPLTVKVAGPDIRYGVMKASLAGKLISALQSAVYQVGVSAVRERFQEGAERPEEVQLFKGLRKLLRLDLVATAPGSFVLAMDVRWEERPLFPELDPATIAIKKLISHMNEIRQSPETFSGNRSDLRGLRKVAELIKPGVESIDISFQTEEVDAETSVVPVVRDRIALLLGAPREDEKTVLGQLIEIDVENNTCIIHPDNQPRVNCAYDEELEDDLIGALRKRIEMAGQFIPLDWPRGHYRITRIERFRIVEEEVDF